MVLSVMVACFRTVTGGGGEVKMGAKGFSRSTEWRFCNEDQGTLLLVSS